MAKSSNLGYPRIGLKREIKEEDRSLLVRKNRKIRSNKELLNNYVRINWLLQKEIGIDHIPSNDFSYYDHILDTTLMAGAVPERFNWDGEAC